MEPEQAKTETEYDLIVITGPTASGKTSLAAELAYRMNGEVISADSRQVYRNMDIGTGKDYDDYTVNGVSVPYHLVDIVDAGYKYNVFEFQQDFLKVYEMLVRKKKLPVVCGGSGMYLDSIVSGYRLMPVPVNEELRKSLSDMPLGKLKEILSCYKELHNETDVDNVKRAIRAIEIEVYYSTRPHDDVAFPKMNPLIIGISFDRNTRRERISHRLRDRIENGLIEEVEGLIESGVSEETLEYYGLEYKYVVRYLKAELTYEEMFSGLETAIHQFAKRQMTWFRGMERKGAVINWIDGAMPPEKKVEFVMNLFKSRQRAK